jgi:N6-adenosine-specific RNA methylase IME4
MIGRVPVHPLADVFPLIEGAEFDALVADIRARGMMEPVKLWRGMLIDGRNRLRALMTDGDGEVQGNPDAETLICLGEAVDLTDDVREHELPALVVSLNLRRRHLDESQRALIAARIANLGRGRPVDDPANLPNFPGIDASPPAQVSVANAAGMLNVSERSVTAARALIRDAPAPVVADVARGAVAVSHASGVLAAIKTKLGPGSSEDDLLDAYRAMEADIEARREAKRRARIDEKKGARAVREASLAARIEAANAALAAPGGARYGVILADPEWQFDVWSPGGMDRAADNLYPTSTIEAIKARPVANLAARDCVLFLWATVPMLPAALEVMAAWGFTYRSHAIWLKDRIGTGYWFRNRHELLLVGTRGEIPAPAMGTQSASVIEAPVGPHSAKPGAVHAMIEAYFPTLPKIELNARAARPGWALWGAEAPEVVT